MNGRLERDIKINGKITEKLQNAPSYLNEWYLHLSASGLSEASCLDYINKINRFLQFIQKENGDSDIHNITQNNINKYMAIMRKKDVNGEIKYTSDSYKQCIWSCLNNFFEFAVASKYISVNYVKNVKRSKNNDLERINKNRIRLKEDDYAGIIANIKNGVGTKKAKSFQKRTINRDIAIVLLLMTTGMRKSALLQINVEDLDINSAKLLVTDKGDKKITYWLGSETVYYISKWLIDRRLMLDGLDQDALFISCEKNRLSNSALDKLVDKYCKDVIGRHVSPHKFRSGFCSNVYERSGGNIEITRRAAGHANVSTTQRYIVMSNNEMETASNIMNSIVKGNKNIKLAAAD